MKKYPKNFINYLFYFFVFLFCIAATGVCSCTDIAKKAEKIAAGIPFNYPGLRIETRSSMRQEISSKNPRVVCFGDSVTFGWNVKYELSYPFLLEKKLSGNYPDVEVINSGIGGNTILDAFSRLDKDVLEFKPDIVVINFGLNDGMLQKNAGKAVPVDPLYYRDGSYYFFPQVNIIDFKISYKAVLETLKKNNTSILVLGLSPITDDFPPGRNTDFQKKQKEAYSVYNDRIREIASGCGLDFLDIWKVYNLKGDINKYIQADAIHPNEAGLELISESVFTYMLENYKLFEND